MDNRQIAVAIGVVVVAILIGVVVGQNIHCLSFLGNHACVVNNPLK